MSIGYKKISEMIIEEVGKIEEIDDRQKKLLANLCEKIYMHNSNSVSINHFFKLLL